MAQDALRLADQFFFGELADVDEIAVGIFNVAMQIRGRNNRFGFIELKFYISDG